MLETYLQQGSAPFFNVGYIFTAPIINPFTLRPHRSSSCMSHSSVPFQINQMLLDTKLKGKLLKTKGVKDAEGDVSMRYGTESRFLIRATNPVCGRKAFTDGVHKEGNKVRPKRYQLYFKCSRISSPPCFLVKFLAFYFIFAHHLYC